jgi:hypothetical protein
MPRGIFIPAHPCVSVCLETGIRQCFPWIWSGWARVRDEQSCDLRDKPSHGTSTSTASAILITHIHTLHIFATSTLHASLKHCTTFSCLHLLLFICSLVFSNAQDNETACLTWIKFCSVRSISRRAPCSVSVSGQLPAWPGVFPCTEFPPGLLAMS